MGKDEKFNFLMRNLTDLFGRHKCHDDRIIRLEKEVKKMSQEMDALNTEIDVLKTDIGAKFAEIAAKIADLVAAQANNDTAGIQAATESLAQIDLTVKSFTP